MAPTNQIKRNQIKMTKPHDQNGDILALDYGDARVGVARASLIARLPEPLPIIINDNQLFDNIRELVASNNVSLIVVGLPYNSYGQSTSQTDKIRKFADELALKTGLMVKFADESLTSVDADTFLRGQKTLKYDQDSIAACYILEEYFRQNKN